MYNMCSLGKDSRAEAKNKGKVALAAKSNNNDPSTALLGPKCYKCKQTGFIKGTIQRRATVGPAVLLTKNDSK